MEQFGGMYADLDVEILRDIELALPPHGGHGNNLQLSGGCWSSFFFVTREF